MSRSSAACRCRSSAAATIATLRAITNSGGKIDPATALTGTAIGWRGPWGTTYPRNLRITVQDKTEDQFVEYAKKFQTRPPMPYYNVNAMDESDIRSLYQYIKSLGAPGDQAPEFVPPGHGAEDALLSASSADHAEELIQRCASGGLAARPGFHLFRKARSAIRARNWFGHASIARLGRLDRASRGAAGSACRRRRALRGERRRSGLRPACGASARRGHARGRERRRQHRGRERRRSASRLHGRRQRGQPASPHRFRIWPGARMGRPAVRRRDRLSEGGGCRQHDGDGRACGALHPGHRRRAGLRQGARSSSRRRRRAAT